MTQAFMLGIYVSKFNIHIAVSSLLSTVVSLFNCQQDISKKTIVSASVHLIR